MYESLGSPGGARNYAAPLIEGLPLLHRLALAYAPSAMRDPTLGLLALDSRLAGIVRAASEPMLAQLRLAWWREQLSTDPRDAPANEPLLAVLQSWGEARSRLVALVDGWEQLTGAAPLPATALSRMAEARAAAFGALAVVAGLPEEALIAERMGGNWALADLAGRLANPEERRHAAALARARDWRRARLSRPLRPLVVLHGLAARQLQGRPEHSPVTVLAAMRLGLLGC